MRAINWVWNRSGYEVALIVLYSLIIYRLFMDCNDKIIICYFSWKFIEVMNLDLNIHGIINTVPKMSWQTSNSPIAVQRFILTLPRNTRFLITTKNDHWCFLTIVQNKQISNCFLLSVVYWLLQNMSRPFSSSSYDSPAFDLADIGRFSSNIGHFDPSIGRIDSTSVAFKGPFSLRFSRRMMQLVENFNVKCLEAK